LPANNEGRERQVPIKIDLSPEASRVIDLRHLSGTEKDLRESVDVENHEKPVLGGGVIKIDLRPEASRVIDLRQFPRMEEEKP
jgi:hypothetical protein